MRKERLTRKTFNWSEVSAGAESQCAQPQLLDSLSGGSLATGVLRPLQARAQAYLPLLQPPSPPAAGAAGPQQSPGGGDLEAMLAVSRLLQTIERALELLEG